MPLINATWIDGDPKWLAGASAFEPPTAQNRAIGHRQEHAVLQHADFLAVAQPATPFARPARIRGEAKRLDQQRKARLGELGRLIARVRHNVNGVIAIGIIAPAGTATQHLPR